jgi:hypothetical protein
MKTSEIPLPPIPLLTSAAAPPHGASCLASFLRGRNGRFRGRNGRFRGSLTSFQGSTSRVHWSSMLRPAMAGSLLKTMTP